MRLSEFQFGERLTHRGQSVVSKEGCDGARAQRPASCPRRCKCLSGGDHTPAWRRKQFVIHSLARLRWEQAHESSESLSQGVGCGGSFRSLRIKRQALARSLSEKACEASLRASWAKGGGSGCPPWHRNSRARPCPCFLSRPENMAWLSRTSVVIEDNLACWRAITSTSASANWEANADGRPIPEIFVTVSMRDVVLRSATWHQSAADWRATVHVKLATDRTTAPGIFIIEMSASEKRG